MSDDFGWSGAGCTAQLQMEGSKFIFYLLLIGSLDLDLNLSNHVNNLLRLQISIPQALAFSNTSVVPPDVLELAILEVALVCLDFSKIASALDF